MTTEVKERKTLNQARKDKGLTQRAIADMIGVTETTVRNIEKGRANPSFQLSIKISKVLELNFENLWNEDFINIK